MLSISTSWNKKKDGIISFQPNRKKQKIVIQQNNGILGGLLIGVEELSCVLGGSIYVAWHESVETPKQITPKLKLHGPCKLS